MNKEYFAIEVISERHYCIKKVSGGWILPVNGKSYKTLGRAKAVAAELGLIIEKIGSSYQIV